MLIKQGRAITASAYKENRHIKKYRMDDPEVYKIAEDYHAKADWQPEDVYVMDLGLVNDGWRIVEINSFTCSGLYKCDYDKVIHELENYAVDTWNS